VRSLVALFVAVAVLSGCASSATVAQGTRVVVVEHDYGLHASSSSVHAGTVTFHVENHGPSTHEFIIDEASLPAGGLPLQANGIQVVERSPQLHNVEATQLRVGTTQDLRVRLQAGTYVMFCNLAGHYLGGMHLALNVTS
jgi:uncharacterized cupredoxin-like copper-binding protein